MKFLVVWSEIIYFEISICDKWRGSLVVNTSILLFVKISWVAVLVVQPVCELFNRKIRDLRDFPSGPVFKFPSFHCREHGFSVPYLETKIPNASRYGQVK